MNCTCSFRICFTPPEPRAELYGGLDAAGARDAARARPIAAHLPAPRSSAGWPPRFASTPARLPLAPLSLRGRRRRSGRRLLAARGSRAPQRRSATSCCSRDSGASRSTAGEAARARGALNAHFAEDGLEFIAPAPQRWYVRARDEPRVRTHAHARRPSDGVSSRLLPPGEDGPRWHRHLNEAQMLLHEHPGNEAREARGELPVNSVWLWGGGRVPEMPRARPMARVWSDDPLAAGIAGGRGTCRRNRCRQSAAQLLESRHRRRRRRSRTSLVLRRPARRRLPATSEAWRGALQELEARWFAPLLDALRRRRARRSLDAHRAGTRSMAARSTVDARFDPLKFWRAARAEPLCRL